MRILCTLLAATLLALAVPAGMAAEYSESFDEGRDPAAIMAGTLLIGARSSAPTAATGISAS